ncbi:MAG: class I SAM-dependent methyltransferase [Butyrivibrio sp.]|nr:class I SAM-dependent methyltransferase [Butyrivibrio sp.]
MQAYTVFAKVYDKFMTEIPYGDWADMICGRLKERGIADGALLELGCGTGSFLALMAKKGYEAAGIDASPDMLKQARRKAARAGLRVRLDCQDMRALEASRLYRAAVSVCDSVNYLRDTFDLQSAFKGVGAALERGGLFIFDMKTESFYKSLGSSVYTDENEAGRYVWENDYDGELKDNFYAITFYLKAPFGLYRRYTEEHVQHAFTEEEVRECAAESGFAVEGVYGMDLQSPPDWNAERVYYILERI